MAIVVLGFKEFGRSAQPHPIYVGNSGDEAVAAAAKVSGFVRIGRAHIHDMIPMQIQAAEVKPAEVQSVEPEIQNKNNTPVKNPKK